MKDQDILSTLKECFSILEDIENDGWVVRGNSSTAIPLVLDRVRSLLYPPIDFVDDSLTIHFQCSSCSTHVQAARNDNERWTYASCSHCSKQYKILWKRDNILTKILPYGIVD